MDGKDLVKFSEHFLEPSLADLIYNIWYPSLVELKLALVLGTYIQMFIYLAPGGHAMPSEALVPFRPTGKLTLDEAKFLMEIITTIGQLFMGFGIFYVILLPLCFLIDRIPSRIGGGRQRNLFTKTINSCGTYYLIVSHVLLAIAIWNMANSGPPGRRMWKHPFGDFESS